MTKEPFVDPDPAREASYQAYLLVEKERSRKFVAGMGLAEKEERPQAPRPKQGELFTEENHAEDSDAV